MQMSEKVGKSRNTVFFQWFEAPEGRKVGSLKRQVRSQLARWEMKNCKPLSREAHFEVKMYKTHHARTTFGSWECGKSARRCGARHISKSKCTKHTMFGQIWKLRRRKSARRCGAKHISKSKCTKHTKSGPLLEVEMSKKCTPLWREAHFDVKVLKTPGVRTTFGGSDVVSRGRRKGLCTLSKVNITKKSASNAPARRPKLRFRQSETAGQGRLPRWLCTLCGRRGTWQHPVSFGVAGVALGDIDVYFVRQVWHMVTSTFTSLCAAGVALDDIDRHVVWQGWHLWHWAGSGGARPGRRGCSRGRRGTWRDLVSFRLAWHLAAMATWHDHPRLTHNTCTYDTSNTQYVLTPHLYTHTSAPHSSFTHNSLTHSCPRNTCTRNAFASTPVPYRSFTHSTFTHESSPDTTSTHHAFTHTHFFHQQHFYTELFHTLRFDMHFLHTPILHHLFSLSCLSHPIFTFLWLFIGRIWHVGLSGPLISIFGTFSNRGRD